MYLLIYVCISYIITDIDECAINPCQNGGECTDEVIGYTCTCAGGYTGDLCETGMTEQFFSLFCLTKAKPKTILRRCTFRPLYIQSHYV
jgi:hypothetical protein